ncbi:hypothetical protein GX563_09855 [Candidatus Bathyarchaeota archaeon]|nr:hypothetical protein [Candidatus Bathyarchaeota archaeon]
MTKRCGIRGQMDRLSGALLSRGVGNVVQTLYPCKYGVVWVPLAKVSLKVSSGLQVEADSRLFLEVYSSRQRVLLDDSVTLLIPLVMVEADFDLLVDVLVRYLFLRYRILQLMAGL